MEASRGKRALTMLATAAIAMTLAACPASREIVETAPDRFSDLSKEQRKVIDAAQDAISGGDCATAWAGLWNAFRDGEPVAATALAEFIMFDGLVPPGSSADRLSQERHATMLAMHGLASSSIYSQQIVDALTGRRDESADLPRCMRENAAQLGVCVNELIFYRLLPAPSVYIAETEALARAVVQPAICAPQLALLPAAT